MKVINESSLSKLYRYMQEYDVICISADKYLPDRKDYDTQAEYEYVFRDRLGKQKKWDRKTLRIELNEYTVIPIKGFYQYNSSSVPSKEKSYAVVNTQKKKDFLEDLLFKAIKCKQQSIYYVPAGTFEGSWVYTGVDLSQEDEIDLDHTYGQVEDRGPVHFGTFAEDEKDGTGYSLINGRPFASYYANKDGVTVKKDVIIPKVKNKSKNITIIDESFVKDDFIFPNAVTKELGSYAGKVKRGCL